MSDASKIDPEICADALLALGYYGALAAWENIRILTDSHAGDIVNDFVDLQTHYGHVARAVTAYSAAELSVDFEAALGAVDHALMERLGIDVERRYNPLAPSSDPEDDSYDSDYDPEVDDAMPCCNLRKGYVAGQVELAKGDDGAGVLPDQCPLCGSPPHKDSILNKLGQVQDYICNVTLHECGHYTDGFFGGSDKCIYVRSLKETAAGNAVSGILERFEDQHTTGEGWGRVSLQYVDGAAIGIRAYVRGGYAKELPADFEGLPVQLVQLDH